MVNARLSAASGKPPPASLNPSREAGGGRRRVEVVRQRWPTDKHAGVFRHLPARVGCRPAFPHFLAVLFQIAIAL
jgi:hypothetical protein